MDINKLRQLYNIHIYEIYKNLKKSGKTTFDNNDLWKIFEYFSCIKLMNEYNKIFYQYDDIQPDFKEKHNLTQRDTGIDACDLVDTIVQCKLRKNELSWGDCATFFGSQNVFDEQLNRPIVKWPNLVITRNSESTLSKNLVARKKLFSDKIFTKKEIILYCDQL